MVHGEPFFKGGDGGDDGVTVEFEGASEGQIISRFVPSEIDAGHGFDEVPASAEEAA